MDPYEILGVYEDATQEEIKKAYKSLSQRYHPDKSSGDADKMVEINRAYKILRDPETRAEYDQYGDVEHLDIRKQAESFLIYVFMRLIEDCDDIETIDMKRSIDMSIEALRHDAQSKMIDVKVQKSKYEKAKKKLNPEATLFIRQLDQKIREKQNAISGYEKEIKVADRCCDIMEGFQWDFSQFIGLTFRTPNSTTNAWT